MPEETFAEKFSKKITSVQPMPEGSEKGLQAMLDLAELIEKRKGRKSV